MKNRQWQFLVFTALVIFVFVSFTAAGAAPKDAPSVKLSSDQTQFAKAQDVMLTVTFTNQTKHSVKILKWFAPVNGLEEPVFEVKRNGEPVAYIGAIYKRPAATGSDYIVLKAGKSATYTFNVADFYDMSASGDYEIAYAAASNTLFNENGKTRDTLTSDPINLKVEGRAAKGKPTPPPPPPPGGTSYLSCTDTQKATLEQARTQAKTYANESSAYLNRNNSGTPRYTEWFGVYSASRYNTASSHFASLADAWTNAGVTFDCGCKQNYYAYVYPTKPYVIYLCKVFWTAPLAGTDSKGGTLIHEMSHFNVVAGTDDFVYGQSGARNLADTAPDDAVNNADNHEYFAENNPFLP